MLYPGRMSFDYLRLCPKTCVFTSEYDFLRPDALNLIEQLKAAGIYLTSRIVTYRVYMRKTGWIRGRGALERYIYIHIYKPI